MSGPEPSEEQHPAGLVAAESSDVERGRDAATAPITDAAMVATIAALRDRLSLTNIRMQRLIAEAVIDPPWDLDSIHLSSQTPEFRLSEDALACRFEQSVELRDSADEALARASACAVVEFVLQPTMGDDNGEGELWPDAVALFVQENAYFIAYPYLRQAIHDLTARLGFDAVVLGVLARGQQRPDNVALVRPHGPTSSDTSGPAVAPAMGP